MEKAALKAALDEVMERFHLPSYSASVYDGGTTYSVSGGYADLEKKVPADENKLYAIGSCTKSFTAGAICTLCDQGLLNLDDTVRQYIPEFEMFDSYVSEHLTVRDMLCHRCGLPRHELSWYSRLDVLSETDIIKMFRYLRPNKPFRYAWQYNNQMYALAGFLIERITGKTWQQVVRENIWEPLGIKRAAFGPEEAKAMGDCSVPYLYDEEKKTPYAIRHADIGAMGSAGCIYMATSELVKWDEMLLHHGLYQGKQIISEKLCREMTSPQMLRPESFDPEEMRPYISNQAYGLGLMTEVFEGRRLIHHGGHIDGFMADMSQLPEKDFAIAVLTNMGQIRGAQVMRYVAAEKRLGGTHDWSSVLDQSFAKRDETAAEEKKKLWAAQPKDAKCPVSAEALSGSYQETAYGTIEITAAETEKEGAPSLSVKLGNLILTGRHYANNYFYLEAPEAMPGVSIEACADIEAKGKVIGFSAALDVEGEEKIHFKRLEQKDTAAEQK